MTAQQPGADTAEPCPECGHAESRHIHWPADQICDGWAHCTVGASVDGDACQCWRSWPKLPGVH